MRFKNVRQRYNKEEGAEGVTLGYPFVECPCNHVVHGEGDAWVGREMNAWWCMVKEGEPGSEEWAVQVFDRVPYVLTE